MSERLDQQVARAWLLLGGYENDRSDSIAANAEYDRAGVLVPDSGGPESAPERMARPAAGGVATKKRSLNDSTAGSTALCRG